MYEHIENEEPSAKITKPTYTIFPKDWDARQIYEHLMARAEAIEETKNTNKLFDRIPRLTDACHGLVQARETLPDDRHRAHTKLENANTCAIGAIDELRDAAGLATRGAS